MELAERGLAPSDIEQLGGRSNGSHIHGVEAISLDELFGEPCVPQL